MFDGEKIDFLLKFSVYVQYYLPTLTMFREKWNNILFDSEAKNGGFLDLSGSKKTRECKAI